MEEVLKFLKDNPTYYVGTVDADGNPQIRPFGTIAEINGSLYIQTGKVKDCYKQMEAHPRVCLCTFSPETGTWLRLNADAIPDDSAETCQAMLNEYPMLGDRYAAGDGNCVCLRLDNVEATIYSLTGEEPKTYTF